MGNISKTRKEAALAIYELQKALEAKPFSYSTIYRRIYELNNGNWHFIGKSYDYTA